MRKALIMCILAISITLMVNVKAYADEEPSATPIETPTPTPEINDYYKLPLVKGDSFNINNMLRYYHEVLTTEQQKIVRFLIGSYNYMYLTSRGFSYEDVTDLDDFIDKFDEFASFVVGIDDNYVELNTSRWSTNFQIYIASIITYAGNISKSFTDWVSQDASKVLIPYTTDGLEAWTTYYNDPSNEGVANFGSEQRDWSLGTLYPYMLGDYSFASSQASQTYSNFILNESPVMYSDLFNGKRQKIVSFKDIPLVDTIYILRGVSGFQYYRFGFYDGTFTNYTMHSIECNKPYFDVTVSTDNNVRYNFDTLNSGSIGNLDHILTNAIYTTPIKFDGNQQQYFHNWYIGITHVVLVDDLNTLDNRQDVYNDYTLGLVSDYDWIKKPKSDLPYWWKPLDFDIEIEDPNGDLDPANDDDFTQNIVNNTVINNYDIIAPGVQINVPVNWFESEGNYLDYTYNYSLPFFAFVGDVFLSLGEIRVFLLAGVILLICGGVIGKFLL